MIDRITFADLYGIDGYVVGIDERLKNKQPHIGATFFGREDIEGNEIGYWIDDISVSQIGSLGAYDQPTPFRSFEGAKNRKMGMPYFLEGWHLGEQDLMEINKIFKIMGEMPRNASNIAALAGNAYIRRIITKIYGNTDSIVSGMIDVAEYMLMNMLTKGSFVLQNENGTLTDTYNYDASNEWKNRNCVELTGTSIWEDLTNSDPIAQLLSIKQLVKERGERIVAIIGTSTTLSYLYRNEKVKNYALVSGFNSNYVLTNAQVEQILSDRLGGAIRLLEDDEVFRSWDKSLKNFFPERYVTIITTNDILGKVYYGDTPDSCVREVFGGDAYKELSRLSNGIMVSDYVKPDSNEKIIRVSQSVIPSWEKQMSVYNLYWKGTVTITYNGNGNTEGTVPSASSVTEGTTTTIAAGTGLKKGTEDFASWNTAADGTGTSYAAGASITPNADITLYAQYA